MQDLDLTYEESKQILELGYDFSLVCKEFIYKSGDYIRHFYGVKIKDSVMCYRVIENGVQKESQLVQFKPTTVPIIPKAALQKCLIVDFPVDTEYDYRHFEKCCKDDGVQLEGFNELINFKTSLEAFLWCNENYPKELKQRFAEVIK